MLLLAAFASTVAQAPPVQATVRIVRGQRISREEWQRSRRKREIVVKEDGRKVAVRLIEFE